MQVVRRISNAFGPAYENKHLPQWIACTADRPLVSMNCGVYDHAPQLAHKELLSHMRYEHILQALARATTSIAQECPVFPLLSYCQCHKHSIMAAQQSLKELMTSAVGATQERPSTKHGQKMKLYKPHDLPFC